MRARLLVLLFFITISLVADKYPLSYESGDTVVFFKNTVRMDGLGGQNLRLLNEANGLDEVIVPGRHSWDGVLSYRYGRETWGADILQFNIGVRNKGDWGEPESIARTRAATVKDTEVVFGEHSHAIPVHFPIIREMWLSMSLNEVLDIDFRYHHTFKLGLFPFQLGRGISLGSAYSVVPDLIGYDPRNAIQQYAPGFLLSGDLGSSLRYDLYASISDNKAATFNRVNEKIRGQEYGNRFMQQRGPAIINYILAGRLYWRIIDEPGCMVHVEPYALFNDQREQRVEVLGDASSELGTLGLAIEMKQGDFDAGFEAAFNIGEQKVKGIDRNIIRKELREGIPFVVNSQVRAISDNPDTNDVAGKLATFTPKNQVIIDEQVTNIVQQSVLEPLNGKQIGDSSLRSSSIRFRDAYVNDYNGSMWVFDMAYNFPCWHTKLAAAAGYASGDVNPNQAIDSFSETEKDGSFGGFIGLQEIYSGKRVRSYILMNQSIARIPRVTSFPVNGNRVGNIFGDRFAPQVSRFTNLIFTGGAAWIDCCINDRRWKINPNILSFWQERRSRIFDPQNLERGEQLADRHLGVEINTSIEGQLAKDLLFFTVFGVFAPGDHFDDIQGLPLNREQQRFLDRRDRTGVTEGEFVPTLSTDTAWFINAGLEYKF